MSKQPEITQESAFLDARIKLQIPLHRPHTNITRLPCERKKPIFSFHNITILLITISQLSYELYYHICHICQYLSISVNISHNQLSHYNLIMAPHHKPTIRWWTHWYRCVYIYIYMYIWYDSIGVCGVCLMRYESYEYNGILMGPIVR